MGELLTDYLNDTKTIELEPLYLQTSEYYFVVLMDLLETEAEKVPEEYRDSIIVKVDLDFDGRPHLVFRYKRPKTPEEIATAEALSNGAKVANEMWERQEYERLRAKFET